jgi:hypothetical protein
MNTTSQAPVTDFSLISQNSTPRTGRTTVGSAHRSGLLLRAGSVLLVFLALAVLYAPGATASRASIGGGTASAIVTCDNRSHEIRYRVQMTSDTGRPNQWVGYRIYVQNAVTGTGFWTDWDTTQTYAGAFVTTGFAIWQRNVSLSGTYQLYFEYTWWTGSAWRTAVGEWIRAYDLVQVSRYVGTYTKCYA